MNPLFQVPQRILFSFPFAFFAIATIALVSNQCVRTRMLVGLAGARGQPLPYVDQVDLNAKWASFGWTYYALSVELATLGLSVRATAR